MTRGIDGLPDVAERPVFRLDNRTALPNNAGQGNRP